MKTKDDGGPAFARPAIIAPSGGVAVLAQEGMSLRDWFAGKALSGLINAIMQDECHRWTSANFASEAYEIADAMLAARKAEDEPVA